jgi:hypothetical protein
MRTRTLRYASIALATLGLGLGVAAADSGSISTTGPDSINKISSTSSNTANLLNVNLVGVENNSLQVGASGDASVKHNTTGGSASSGAVTNANSNTTSVGVNNAASSSAWSSMFSGGGSNSASISLTGPDSVNVIKNSETNKLNVLNINAVSVENNSLQVGVSGDASVRDNTTAGSATSGAVTNSNSTSTTVNVSN